MLKSNTCKLPKVKLQIILPLLTFSITLPHQIKYMTKTNYMKRIYLLLISAMMTTMCMAQVEDTDVKSGKQEKA